MIGCDWKSDHHPVDRVQEAERIHENYAKQVREHEDKLLTRIASLEAEVERLRKTTQFLRSERPMARRLTEYENALASIAVNTCCDTCKEAALVAQAALAAKKEKP